jgi:hypothetical protein
MKHMNDETTMSWTNGRGKRETRAINHVIDIRDFRGTPGYPLLFIAANTNLSVRQIGLFLNEVEALEFPLAERPASWIQKRRWLFQQPGTDNHSGPQTDTDGKYAQACEIMAENLTLSLRDLVRLLMKHGIKRGREWCRKHRGDAAR